MAKSLDGLIHDLIDQIALFGERGALPSDFISHVRRYYAASDVFNIDRPFLEKVWEWLIRNPEIQLGDHAGQQYLSLSEVEARNAAAKDARVSDTSLQNVTGSLGTRLSENLDSTTDAPAAESAQAPEGPEKAETLGSANEIASQPPGQIGGDAQISEADCRAGSPDQPSNAFSGGVTAQHAQRNQLVDEHGKPISATEPSGLDSTIRLYTSENRMWHALAGHGPDPNKIKALDFACLSMIAARGPKGIYQHELVRLTGQDKRSLPARTDRLHDDGYIKKTRTSVQQLQPKKIVNTSHLVLKRFVESTSSVPMQNSLSRLSVDEGNENGNEHDGDLNGQETGHIPQWTPDRSWSNQIYELVAQSGTKGMTMRAIRDNLFGQHVRKPVDEYVMRLVECWQISQPLHLRHLSIIRDTTLRGKTNVYIYYTFENFQKLVEQERAFWDGVKAVPDGATNGVNVAAPLDAKPELDDYGFPILDADLFQGNDNDATLGECVSALKTDRFRITRHDPIVAKQANSTYAIKYKTPQNALIPQGKNLDPKGATPPRPKPTPINPRSVGDKTVSVLSNPKAKRHTNLIVKPTGRPRVYPKDGAPIDVDITDSHALKRLRDSQEMAEKYARGKIEDEISCRIEEGGDAVSVTHEVLANVEALRKDEGQVPLSDYSKMMILHAFAGGPLPETTKSRPRGRRKGVPYWPSMAAHTILVPGQPRKPSVNSRHNSKPVPEAIAANSRKRRLPTRLQDSDNEIVISLVKKKRRTANANHTAKALYLPSLAAHSCSYGFTMSLKVATLEGKAKRQEKRSKVFTYFPSIAAHTGMILSPPSQSKAVSFRRKKAPEVLAQPQSNTISLTGALTAESHSLPSIISHPSTAIPLSSHGSEGLYPGWIKFMSKYYLPELSSIPRPHDGVFAGRTKPRRKRASEPPGFRPQSFKVIIFKDARLKALDWFRATEERPSQAQPPAIQKPNLNYAPTQLHPPITPTQNLVTPVAMISAQRWTPINQLRNPPPSNSEVSSIICLSDTPLLPPGGSLNPSHDGTKRTRDRSDNLDQGSPLQNAFTRKPYGGYHFPAHKIPLQAAIEALSTPPSVESAPQNFKNSHSPVVGVESSPMAKISDVIVGETDPPRGESPSINAEHQSPPTLVVDLPAMEHQSDKMRDSLPATGQLLPSAVGQKTSVADSVAGDETSAAATVEDSAEQSNGTQCLSTNMMNPSPNTGEIPTRSREGTLVQIPAFSSTPAPCHSVSKDTSVQSPATPTPGPIRHRNEKGTNNQGLSISKTSLAQSALGHDGAENQTSRSSKPQRTKSKPMSGQQPVAMMNRRGGSVAVLRRKIVMDILEKCEGVFAGYREMTRPFAAEWTKRGQEGTPEEKTIQNTVNSLCAEGSLRQITFVFQTKQGKPIKKTMVLHPGIDDADPRVKELQMKIMAYHPAYFLPKAVLTPEESLSTDAPFSGPMKEGRADISQKIKLGKHNAAEATLATMKAQERAELEDAGQRVNGAEFQQDDEDAVPLMNKTSDPIKRVPYVPHFPPSHTKRSSTVKRPRGGRGERLASIRKPSNVTSTQRSLPQPATGMTSSSGNLVWLPESFAFEDYNYEENRPTVVEPTVREDTHQRHARYGNQLGTPKPSRQEDDEGLAHSVMKTRSRRKRDDEGLNNSMTKTRSRQEGDATSSRPRRDSIPHSNTRPALLNTPHQPFYQASSKPSSLLENFAGILSPEDKLASCMYVSPYAAEPNLPAPESLEREIPTHTAVSPQHLTLAVPATTAPRQKELLVGFMDATHYFHQTTRTFSVGFTGLGPPRQINKRVGTCAKPYSLGPRIFHPEFPAPRNLLPKRPLDAGDTQFEQEVDALLNRELETTDLRHTKFEGLPFINHTFHHTHVTVEALEAKMNAMKEVLYSSENGRLRNRKFPSLSEVTAKIGKSKLESGTKKTSAAATEALKRIEMRAPLKPLKRIEKPVPLKRRRVTSLVEKSTLDSTLKATATEEDHRPTKFRRIRGPRDAKSLGPGGEIRLLTAVLIVRTLTGGFEKVINWGLVAKVFEPGRSETFIHSRWNYVLQKHKMMLPKMEDDFQDLYAEAYEEGSVPPLDYDNLADHDWKWLTEWAMDRLNTASKSQPELPGERAAFNNLYEMQDTSKIDINDYYGINGLGQTVASRVKLINSSAFVHPSASEYQDSRSPDQDQLSIAKTWIRANVITPEETYNPSLARAKLETMPTHIIEEALKQLLLDKVLSQENKGRLVPGRNYDISEQFISRLKKNILPEHFQRAVAYKQHLDEAFSQQSSVLYSPTSSDGDNLVIINLQAHHRIHVVPINVPANKWGQTDGSYESRHMDKARLNFQMELRPTATYTAGHPLLPLPKPPSGHLDDPMAKIPLWYDIHGAFVPVMWDMALAAVMAVLSVRPGVEAEEIAKNVTPAVEAWELELVVGWLVDAGAAERVGSGYMTTEWWYLAFGKGKMDKGKGKERAAEMENDHMVVDVE